jgi:predicted dehydrogenase
MRILIAGIGSIGRRHLSNLLALGERDIILYRTYQGPPEADEPPPFPVETELEEALARQPQAVIVSNPTALHLDVAIPAAQAGCHLLLEKPISHSLERVGQLEDAVRQGGGRVLVGYQFRFHPGLGQVRRLLTEGAIGRPLSVRAHWGEYLPGWHPGEDYRQGYSARRDLGGGVVLTLSHPLDYLRWLLGEVAALWAFNASHSDLGLAVEDSAEIGLRFASGALGSLHLDYVQRPPAHRLEIIGTRGTLQWDNQDGSVRAYSAAGGNWETFPAPAGFGRNHLFMQELRHFLALVKGEVEATCTLEDGRRALELALAALESSDHGRLVRPRD